MIRMFEKVVEAYDIVRHVADHTPVLTSSTLDEMTGAQCFLKCENFQRTGSFKFRGAYNALSNLTSDQRKRGVVAPSSGNHAQALALAAKLLGIKAVIVMPENAPKVKVAATEGYGAEVVFCGFHPKDRVEVADGLVERDGLALIHPSNDLDVIAGAGTAAYELIEEVGGLNYVFCPVGGGGLLSGTAVAVKGLCSSVKVIGVEPRNADDAYRSFEAGEILPMENPDTIADGLRTSLGSNTFRIIREFVDQIVTVSEGEIVDAMEFLWERMKLVVEPSGAVSLAGVLWGYVDLSSRRVGVIVSGGNVDVGRFFAVLRRRVKV
jgi:threonine ammonia-lyase medium form